MEKGRKRNPEISSPILANEIRQQLNLTFGTPDDYKKILDATVYPMGNQYKSRFQTKLPGMIRQIGNLEKREREKNSSSYLLAEFLDQARKDLIENPALEICKRKKLKQTEAIVVAVLLDINRGMNYILKPIGMGHLKHIGTLQTISAAVDEIEEQLEKPINRDDRNSVLSSRIHESTKWRLSLEKDPSGFTLIDDVLKQIREGDLIPDIYIKEFVLAGAEIVIDTYHKHYPEIDKAVRA